MEADTLSTTIRIIKNVISACLWKKAKHERIQPDDLGLNSLFICVAEPRSASLT